MKRSTVTALALAAALLAGSSVRGAESPSSPPAPPAKSAEKSADPTKEKSARDGVQGMEREFGERSKDLIEKRKILLERLRLAKTEEEKQRIISELRQQQQQRLEQQREAARQIREQMQTKRPATPGS